MHMQCTFITRQTLLTRGRTDFRFADLHREPPTSDNVVYRLSNNLQKVQAEQTSLYKLFLKINDDVKEITDNTRKVYYKGPRTLNCLIDTEYPMRYHRYSFLPSTFYYSSRMDRTARGDSWPRVASGFKMSLVR